MHHCYKIAMLQQLMNGVRQMTHRTELWQSSPSTVGTARGALSRGNPGRSPAAAGGVAKPQAMNYLTTRLSF
jgi:hypothetical protein